MPDGKWIDQFTAARLERQPGTRLLRSQRVVQPQGIGKDFAADQMLAELGRALAAALLGGGEGGEWYAVRLTRSEGEAPQGTLYRARTLTLEAYVAPLEGKEV